MPRRDPESRRAYNRAYNAMRLADPTWRAPTVDVAFKFWSKVQKTDTCWLWQGCLDRDGYGRFSPTRSRSWRAHRYSYEESIGPIPNGLVLHHECRVKNCVRPSHLSVVTSRYNTMADPTPAALNLAKTHCPRGHKYDLENTRYSGTSRNCRACARENARNRRKEQSRVV